MTDYLAPPLSRKDIRNIVVGIRRKIGLTQRNFNVIRLADIVFPSIIEGFELVVVPNDHPDVIGKHAYACPETSQIVMSNEIYNSAERGDGFGRMTVIHEVGHLALHRGISPSFARARVEGVRLRPFESAEWQAKAFAGEFLIPAELLLGNESIQDLVELFGVTPAAAAYQHNIYVKEGLIR